MVGVSERPNEAAAIAHATAESASSTSPLPTPGAHPTTDHVPASTGLSGGGGSAPATADSVAVDARLISPLLTRFVID